MSELHWTETPTLRRPIFVLALEGFFDAAFGATSTVEWIQKITEARSVAEIDPDAFFDFTSRRPRVRLDDDDQREIVWPHNNITVSGLDAGDRDLVLLSGVEPHMRWRSYIGCLLAVIRELKVELVVTLGTTADQIPHTRTPIVVGSTAVPELARTLGLSAPTYQGQTGVVGVLHTELERLSVPSISLRAPACFYASSATNPKLVVALAGQVERVTGVPTRVGELAGTVADWTSRVDEAVQQDNSMAPYIPQLELAYDHQFEQQLAQQADVSAEVERFLRGLDDSGAGGDSAR